MPVPCPACERLLALDSLRCRYCGADARGARHGGAPMLGFGDLLGYRDVETFMRQEYPATYRRNVIIDRIAELAPEFSKWARLAPEARGPAPAIPSEHEAEVVALCAEYEALATGRPCIARRT